MTTHFQNPDEIISFLDVANRNLDLFLDDDFYMICQTLNTISERLWGNPELLTDAVLSALHMMASNNPSHDPAFDQRHTPRLQVCHSSINILADTALTQKNNAGQLAIAYLDDIIAHNMNYTLRSKAAGIFCHVLGNNPTTIALLEKHGDKNSVADIRQKCREGLLQIARDHPAIVEPALSALIRGMNHDRDVETRMRCAALLNNRVRSTGCGADELIKLKAIFEHATADRETNDTLDDLAKKNGITDHGVSYWAKKGISQIDERIRTNGKGDIKFP